MKDRDGSTLSKKWQVWIRQSTRDKRDGFQKASSDLQIPPHILEKDFWVTYLLDIVFNRLHKYGVQHRFMFKGGTSLSKCFNLIDRFSEDLDLSLSKNDLGFSGSDAPENQLSISKKKKVLSALKEAGYQFVKNSMVPVLNEIIGMDGVQSDLKIIKDEESIYFSYSPTIAAGNYAYVQPVIKIEYGTKADQEPVLTVGITPLIFSSLGSAVQGLDESIAVKVLSPARTFWEKVILIHAINSGNDTSKVRHGVSRHLYDMYKIMHSVEFGTDAVTDISLLIRAAEYNNVYYYAKWADYGSAKPGSIKLEIGSSLIPSFRKDYQEMSEMFYSTPPSFEELLEFLINLEQTINL